MVEVAHMEESTLTSSSVICVTYMRDASGKFAPQDVNFYNQSSADGSQWDHQVSTTSNPLDWDGLRASTP
jgi:hypothetical protein